MTERVRADLEVPDFPGVLPDWKPREERSLPAKKRSSGRRYSIDPETGHAELVATGDRFEKRADLA